MPDKHMDIYAISKINGYVVHFFGEKAVSYDSQKKDVRIFDNLEEARRENKSSILTKVCEL